MGISIDEAVAEVRSRAQIRTDISDHLETIFFETLSVGPKLIVELGVRGGESTFAFERAARVCGAVLVSVDINDCSRVTSWPEWNFVQGDDVQFARDFEEWCSERSLPRRVDVLFIDTSHEYHHTLAELHGWLPFLAPRGKLLLHDTNLRSDGLYRDGSSANAGGDNRAVTEALEEVLGVPMLENDDFVVAARGWLIQHTKYSHGFTVVTRAQRVRVDLLA